MNITKQLPLASVIAVTLGWSSLAAAGCTPPQVSGVWEAAFSSGNSCRIKLKSNGAVDPGKSVCFDPDRGSAGLDSGTLKVAGDCFAEGEIVLGGQVIELAVQFSHDRAMAAGRIRVPGDGSKASVVMVRVP